MGHVLKRSFGFTGSLTIRKRYIVMNKAAGTATKCNCSPLVNQPISTPKLLLSVRRRNNTANAAIVHGANLNLNNLASRRSRHSITFKCVLMGMSGIFRAISSNSGDANSRYRTSFGFLPALFSFQFL